MTARKKLDTLQARVAYLVDTVHAGNVSEAAAEAGLPQRTLARLYAGEVERPRAQVFTALARHFGTDVEWLAKGEGKPPDYEGPPERVRLRLLLRRITPNADVRDAVEDLANAPARALLGYLADQADTRLGPSSLDQIQLAYEASARSWRLLLDALVRSHGYGPVADYLLSAHVGARLGFAGFGLWMESVGVVPEGMVRNFLAQLRRGGQLEGDSPAFMTVEATQELAEALRAPQPPSPSRVSARGSKHG